MLTIVAAVIGVVLIFAIPVTTILAAIGFAIGGAIGAVICGIIGFAIEATP